MSYSVSSTTPFARINWDNFENRPPIDNSMPFCEEKDWYEDVKCCMSAGSLEYVVEISEDNGLADTPEVKFLKEYPCLNGLEIDHFVDELDSMSPQSVPEVGNEKSEPQPLQCLAKSVFDGLIRILPQTLIESIRPYVCRES